MDDSNVNTIISFKWNNHSSTFFNVLSNFRIKETLTDATLACEGKFYPIHKLVLSTCSDYFHEIFERTNCRSPVIILKGVRTIDLEALLDYMYHGEVEIRQTELPELLQAAECLRVKGLAVPDDDFSFTPPRKVLSVVKSDTSECKSDTSENHPSVSYHLPLDVDDTKDQLMTPPRKSCEIENHSDHPAKRVKREIFVKNCGEDQLEATSSLHSTKNLSKPLNAVEVPLQFQSYSPISPQTVSSKVLEISHSPVSPVKANNCKKRNNISSRDQRARSLKEIRIKSKPMKTIRPRNRKKHSVKLQSTFLSSDSKPLNQKVFYINHDDKATYDETEDTELGSFNFSEDNLQNSINYDLTSLIADNASSANLEQPSTSMVSPKRKRYSRSKKDSLAAMVEEFCNDIGVPDFSELLTPYLEGHNLDKKKKISLSTQLINELLKHLQIHKFAEKINSNSLKTIFYLTFQMKIIEKYPNIIQEESTRKKRRKGPLGYLIDRLSGKLHVKSKGRKQSLKVSRDEQKLDLHLYAKPPGDGDEELDAEDDEEESFEPEDGDFVLGLENSEDEKETKNEEEMFSPQSHDNKISYGFESNLI